MKSEFFKFPSTPHLIMMKNVKVREDKVLSEEEQCDFLRHELIIEEKIDGANLGISFDKEGNILLQNRGAILQRPGIGQWKKIDQWLNVHINALFETLIDRYILFGEWCYARHSISYNRLPDWFLGFDLYDKHAGKFLSVAGRDRMFVEMGIRKVPYLAKGFYSLSGLLKLLVKSQFSDNQSEGLYLRIDQGEWLLKRAKIVRSAFIQSVQEHWSSLPLETNQMTPLQKLH